MQDITFHKKRIVIASLLHRHFIQLECSANGHLAISENKLCASQLPDQVIKPDGFMLQRPAYWK